MKLRSVFKHFHSRKCTSKCRLRNGVLLSRPQCVNWWGAWCDNGGGRHGGRIWLHDNMLIVSQTEHILITAWMKVVRQNNVTHPHDSVHNKGNPIINVFFFWTDIFASILQWKYNLWTGLDCYPTSIVFLTLHYTFPLFKCVIETYMCIDLWHTHFIIWQQRNWELVR